MTVKENESQSVDYRPLIGLLIAVAAVLAIIGLAQMSRNDRAAQGGVQGQLVVSDGGRIGKRTNVFTIPDGCSRQTFSYTGGHIVDTAEGWARFRVLTGGGRDVLDTNRIYIVDGGRSANADSMRLSLSAGDSYMVDVATVNAHWSFDIKCR